MKYAKLRNIIQINMRKPQNLQNIYLVSQFISIRKWSWKIPNVRSPDRRPSKGFSQV